MAEPRNVPDYVAKSIFNGIDAVVLAIGLMSARFSDTASVDENIRRIYRAIGQAKIGYTSAEAEDEFGDTILAAVGHIRAVEKEKAESPKEWRKKVRSLERRLAKLHGTYRQDLTISRNLFS